MREVVGVHGAAVKMLPVSMMDAGAPAYSGQQEGVGELGLGHENMVGQEKRRKGEGNAGKSVSKPSGTPPSPG